MDRNDISDAEEILTRMTDHSRTIMSLLYCQESRDRPGLMLDRTVRDKLRTGEVSWCLGERDQCWLITFAKDIHCSHNIVQIITIVYQDSRHV